VSICECNTSEGGFIEPKEISEKLLDMNILRVLIEGGAKVHGTFLDNKEIDYLIFSSTNNNWRRNFDFINWWSWCFTVRKCT